MQWYPQAILLRIGFAAACQVVYPLTSGAVVVGVVVATIGVVVDTIRDTCVLHPVTSCLQIARHTAGFCPCLVLQELHAIHLRFA